MSGLPVWNHSSTLASSQHISISINLFPSSQSSQTFSLLSLILPFSKSPSPSPQRKLPPFSYFSLSLPLFFLNRPLSPLPMQHTHTQDQQVSPSNMLNVTKSLGLQTLHVDYVQITMINSIGDISS